MKNIDEQSLNVGVSALNSNISLKKQTFYCFKTYNFLQ